MSSLSTKHSMITRRGQEEDAAPKSWESNGAHRHGRRTSSKRGNAGWESPAGRRRECRASYHLSERPCDGRWPRPGAKLGCWLPARCSPSIFSRLRLPPCLRPRPYVHTYIQTSVRLRLASCVAGQNRWRPHTPGSRITLHTTHHPRRGQQCGGKRHVMDPRAPGRRLVRFCVLCHTARAGRPVDESTTHNENAPPPLPFAMRGKTPTPSPLQGPRELGSRLHASRGI